jgi:peroxiredoxin
LAFAGPASAQESDDAARFKVAKAYEQIVADYQRIAATNSATARAAAGRLVTFAYRNVVDRAKDVEELDADDLYALGACHEGLGQLDRARELFSQSLKQEPRPRTHLAIVRVNLEHDLDLADEHFAAAAKLNSEYPSLRQFRVALSNAHVRQQDWGGAADYLERYMEFTKSLAQSQPGNPAVVAANAAVEKRLATLRRFAEMTGNTAPALNTQHWVQGKAVKISGLRGKVVLLDFCAMWAAPSRARMERLKKLHAKYADQGLEVMGVTLAYGHRYDPEKDEVDVNGDRAPADERADLGLFAKKHEIAYRLAVIGRATTDEFGVTSLPHTVVLDKQGQVNMILQAGDKEAEAEMEATVRELLGIE